MKKRIIIADDDAMLRIAFKSLLCWQQYGYEIIGEAENGKQALTLCRQLHPDILFTDMKMPVMDGVGLLRALAEEPQRPVVIALSGYDDFALVRDAMRLGAVDYLLKLELSGPRLLQCLQQTPVKGQQEPLEKRSAAAADTGRVLRNLVSHFYLADTEMDAALQQAEITFETEPVYCMLVRAGDWFRFEDADEVENHTLQYSMENIALEIVSDCMKAYQISGKTGEVYLFAALKRRFAGRTELVQRTAARLRDILRQYLDIRCVVAVGSGSADAAGMRQAAEQAAETMRRRFCLTTDGVLWWQEVSMLQPAEQNAAVARCSDALYAGLNALDSNRTEQACDTLIETFEHAGLSHAGMLQTAAALQNGVCECLERCGRSARQTLKTSYRDLRAILALNSASDCIAWLREMQEDIALFFSCEGQDTAKGNVQRAVETIEAQYAEQLSLRELAEDLQLSPGYLSVQIKRQTGMNFSEYLMHVRLEQAKRLLEGSDIRIADVAAQVGYADQFYFSRLFKRATGITPSDYRRQGG